MGGIWTDGNLPIRDGAYIDFATFGTPAVPAGNNGIVGIPITADWGPVREFVLLDSDVQFRAIFGPNAAHKSYLVQEAFRGGALRVLAYRMYTTEVLDDDTGKASVVLSDDTDEIVELRALHPGTRGNNLTVTVTRNPVDTLRTDIYLYEGPNLREKYTDLGVTGPTFDHLALVAAINNVRGGSQLVEAILLTNTPGVTRLANVAAGSVDGSFTGGDDGVDGSGNVPLTAILGNPGTGFTGALDSYEFEGGFDVFTLPDLVDSTTPGDPSITAALIAWTQAMNDQGQYVESLIGGDLNETVDTAIARSTSAGSEYVVNLGVTDLNVTYPDGSVVLRRPAAMTARASGIVAGAGIGRAITFNDLASSDSPVSVDNPMNRADIEAAITGGVVVFTKRGARTVIENDVTTFTQFTDEKDATFGNIKSVRTMQQIGRDFNSIIEGSYIGQVNNTSTVRSSLITTLKDYLTGLENRDVLVPGSLVSLDTSHDNTGANIFLILQVQFGRELQRVLIQLRAPLAS